MPICSLAYWLQLFFLPHCEIPSGLGVMIFLKSGYVGIWVPLLLAAARVYAVLAANDPVDCFSALRTVHPASPRALRALLLLLLPHQPVDMFASGLSILSTGSIQSTTPSTQSTVAASFFSYF